MSATPQRHLSQRLASHFDTYQEALILLGARQVGKTTILRRIFKEAQYLNVDNDPIKNALDRYDPVVYQQLLASSPRTVIIDEMQRLRDPGLAVKIIYDQLPGYQLVITGSSVFNIKNKTSESLAGRKIDYKLFPLTTSEFLYQQGVEPRLSTQLFDDLLQNQLTRAPIIKTYDHQSVLHQLLVYGLYPAMMEHQRDDVYLSSFLDSVVFKDLTELALLENKAAAINLLKLLAHQIGSLVNYADLANRLGIDAKTVKRYIELFEQSFIIFTLQPYSSNQRDEIGKAPKVYFYDLGLRNALINNFNPIEQRVDLGQLFENYVITELLKYNSYTQKRCSFYYWRVKSGSEVDLVIKDQDRLLGCEIKTHRRRINQAFLSRYPQASLQVISMENFWP